MSFDWRRVIFLENDPASAQLRVDIIPHPFSLLASGLTKRPPSDIRRERQDRLFRLTGQAESLFPVYTRFSTQGYTMTGVKRQALLPLPSNDMWHESCGNRASRCSSTTPNFSPVERVEGKVDSMRQSHCIYALVQVSLWNRNAGRLRRAQAPGDLCMLLLRSGSCCNRFTSEGERGAKHAHSLSFGPVPG